LSQPQAFSLVFVSEIGDKTFFIAGLLAMKTSRLISLSPIVANSGCFAGLTVGLSQLQAFSLVFVSETGGKTFFIVGLLAMKTSRLISLPPIVAISGVFGW
jgi:putative Ca2+/H+ antiporter (TMEM165/GDT1 family)